MGTFCGQSCRCHPLIMNRFREWLLVIMGIAYAASLFWLPVFILEQSPYGLNRVFGSTILVGGWMDIFSWDFAWYANPLLLIALFRSKSKKRISAILLSIVAFLVAFQSWTATEWWHNEAASTRILYLGPGYYVWHATLFLGAIYCYLGEKGSSQMPPIK